MTMGAGLRPRAKVVELPPYPTVRAPVFYPTSEASSVRLKRGNHAKHIEASSHVTVTCLNSFGDRCGGRT